MTQRLKLNSRRSFTKISIGMFITRKTISLYMLQDIVFFLSEEDEMDREWSTHVQAHVRELIHDKQWMSARFIDLIHRETDVNKEHLAAGIAISIGAYLCVGPNARFVCNMLLTVIPILAIFVYPKERATSKKLFVYWALFGLTTTFEEGLEKAVPIYYFFKMVLHLLLFLRPFCYAHHIAQWLEENNVALRENEKEREREETMAQSARTSVATSRDARTALREAGETKSSLKTFDEKAPGSTAGAQKDGSAETGVTRRGVVHPMVKEGTQEQITSPADEIPLHASTSRVDCGEKSNAIRPPDGTNPMRDDSRYQLTATESGSSNSSSSNNSGHGISTKGMGPAANQNDFLTWPIECIVFNAPFDSAVTYHMKVTNNSYHKIAFAVKGNCMERVTVYPPCGVLASKASMILGVKCQAFDPQTAKTEKDRFVFEYVFCPSETTEFTHKLLQAVDFKRRKNIHVKYNV